VRDEHALKNDNPVNLLFPDDSAHAVVRRDVVSRDTGVVERFGSKAK
jgi:hypothetical protein